MTWTERLHWLTCAFGAHDWKRARRIIRGSATGIKECKRCGRRRTVALRTPRAKLNAITQYNDVEVVMYDAPPSRWPIQ